MDGRSMIGVLKLSITLPSASFTYTILKLGSPEVQLKSIRIPLVFVVFTVGMTDSSSEYIGITKESDVVVGWNCSESSSIN